MAALAAAIGRLLDDPTRRRALGEAARARCVERYSFESARRALFPLVERARRMGRDDAWASSAGRSPSTAASRPRPRAFSPRSRHAGHDVDLISTRRQASVPGLVVRRLPTLRHPSVLRLLSFALAARAAAARHGYDLVQSHERALAQDLYRAGEGCSRAYLEAMGRTAARLNPYHRLVLALERRIFQLRTARHVVAISRQGKAEIERLYGTDRLG